MEYTITGIAVPLINWGVQENYEKCRLPWLGDEENFAYYSSLKGSKQLLSNLITSL